MTLFEVGVFHQGVQIFNQTFHPIDPLQFAIEPQEQSQRSHIFHLMENLTEKVFNDKLNRFSIGDYQILFVKENYKNERKTIIQDNTKITGALLVNNRLKNPYLKSSRFLTERVAFRYNVLDTNLEIYESNIIPSNSIYKIDHNHIVKKKNKNKKKRLGIFRAFNRKRETINIIEVNTKSDYYFAYAIIDKFSDAKIMRGRLKKFVNLVMEHEKHTHNNIKQRFNLQGIIKSQEIETLFKVFKEDDVKLPYQRVQEMFN